ncbi:MAG: UbiA family prenyltransferase [Phycisphaera sp.]|nr:MAG: UbiA family prenyltransferase [Phycisphaera sp.]
MYAAGLATATLELSGAAFDARTWSLSIALITTIVWMAHLLDRAKPLMAWDDPADRMANPVRDAFVQRHRVAMNVLAASLGLSACMLAVLVEPWLVVLVPIGAVSVIIYGSRRSESRRTRPKDVLVIKNALTGLAYATLIGCVLFASVPELFEQRLPWIALGIVCMLVTGDAILSDIDDTPADAMFGTKTVSVLAGRRWARVVAIGIYVIAVAYWLGLGEHTPTTLTLAIGLPAMGMLIAFLPRVRSLIDVRGGVLALVALAFV